MAFELTYAGIPLVINTNESDEWVAESINMEMARYTIPDRPYPGVGLLGITRPFWYTKRPSMSPGCFYHPPFASQWSEGFFLITQTEYDLLQPLISLPIAYPLVLLQPLPPGELPGSGILMYGLSARPLAKFGVNPGLYLLHLVSPRYFWQFITATPDLSSWDSLIASLASTLGITVSTITDDVYGLPHPLSDFSVPNQNAAIMLDAALYNVGLVLVENGDGTYSTLSAAESAIITEENLAKTNLQLAGGDFTSILNTNGISNNTVNAILPSSVDVVFQQTDCTDSSPLNPLLTNQPLSRTLGDTLTVNNTLADAGYLLSGYNYSITFRDLAEAYYQDGSLLNSSQIDDLALQLSQNYYDAQVNGLDITFPSIYPWQPEGLHNIYYCWTKNKCQTRIARMPVNFWSDVEYLHHFENGGCASSGSGGSSSGSGSTSQVCVVTDVQCVDGMLQITSQGLEIQNGSIVFVPCVSGGNTSYSVPGSYTFTTPTTSTYSFYCYGAGGGGGYDTLTGGASGGGGGGSAFASQLVMAGTSVTIVIGAGGAGGSSSPQAGGDGGDSSVSLPFTGVIAQATGGTGGFNSGGSPGSPIIGTGFNGGNGSDTVDPGNQGGGGGGGAGDASDASDSSSGVGGTGGTSAIGHPGGNGGDGDAVGSENSPGHPGGGGGGGCNRDYTSGQSGADGQVIIIWS